MVAEGKEWSGKGYTLLGYLPGESSETGVLDGVGLCPGGRKCEGEPLLDPPPGAVKGNCKKKER